jgi:hypothetical protein
MRRDTGGCLRGGAGVRDGARAARVSGVARGSARFGPPARVRIVAALSALLLALAGGVSASERFGLPRSWLDGLDRAMASSGATASDLDRTGPPDLPAEGPAVPGGSRFAGDVLRHPGAMPGLLGGLLGPMTADVEPGRLPGWGGVFALFSSELQLEEKAGCEAGPAVSLAELAARAELPGKPPSKRTIAAYREAIGADLDVALEPVLRLLAQARCTVDGAVRMPAAARAAVGAAMSTGTWADLGRAHEDVDLAVLWGAAWHLSEDLAEHAARLRALREDAWPLQPIVVPTELGEVWIGTPGSNSGTGDPFLLVDPGGDDAWTNAAQPSDRTPPLRVVLELAGDDLYRSGACGFGCALGGIAVGLDLAGDDTERAGAWSAGSAAFGFATWLDADGDDIHTVGSPEESPCGGAGCAMVGGAAMRDLRGNDTWIGGSMGGVGNQRGVGVLHDLSGDDTRRGGSGFGAGRVGLGILIDGGGGDATLTRHGAGVGASGGAGVYADLGGSDRVADEGWIAPADGASLAPGGPSVSVRATADASMPAAGRFGAAFAFGACGSTRMDNVEFSPFRQVGCGADGRFPPMVPGAADAVDAPEWDARERAARRLRAQPPDDAPGLAAAARLTMEPVWAVRVALLDALAVHGGSGSASAVADSLAGPRPERQAALAALWAIAGRTDGVAVARVLYPLATADGPLRSDALRVLGQTGQRDAVDVCAEALAAHPDAATRCLGSLANCGNREVARAAAAALAAKP